MTTLKWGSITELAGREFTKITAAMISGQTNAHLSRLSRRTIHGKSGKVFCTRGDQTAALQKNELRTEQPFFLTDECKRTARVRANCLVHVRKCLLLLTFDTIKY